MSDFESKFQSMTDLVQSTAKSIMSKLDHITYKMAVNALKNEDFEAANGAIEQLIKDNRPIAIPPLYYVSKAHPSTRIRERAGKAIGIIGNQGEVDKMTDGKSTEEAVKALIEHYGNFKEG
ncbi:MAG: hypothetical protein SGJ27_00825 [Candidatus Melainabacteria bacterium]|nr:hypothetical protein [Candidatus Melainabacteria bacterium]